MIRNLEENPAWKRAADPVSHTWFSGRGNRNRVFGFFLNLDNLYF